MSIYKVTVVQYGHLSLKCTWKYVLAIYNQPANPKAATVFQLSGGGEQNLPFKYKTPEILIPSGPSNFLGELEVGQIPATDAAVQNFGLLCSLVKIWNGTPGWNCQHWISEVLREAAKSGLTIQPYDHVTLMTTIAGTRN